MEAAIALIQLVLLLSVCVFLAAPILLGVYIVMYLTRRAYGRGLIAAASFHAGALSAGWAVWTARPSGWTLPFWTTVKAGVDSATYGHVVEHAAEVLVTNVIVVGLVGGLAASGLALFATRLHRRPDSTSFVFRG